MSHRDFAKRLYVLFALVLALVILAAVVYTAAASAASYPACQEDQPCWSWPTMGNHKRGIVTAWGSPVVVGPCGFRRAYEKAARAGAGRYFLRTNHIAGLHGDTWALRHGCSR